MDYLCSLPYQDILTALDISKSENMDTYNKSPRQYFLYYSAVIGVQCMLYEIKCSGPESLIDRVKTASYNMYKT